MVELLHKLWHYPFIWLKHLIKGPAIIGLGILFALIGIIFLSIRQGSFWVMVVGIPSLVSGVSFIIYGIYDLIFGILSPGHQLIDCPFCQNKIRFKPKEEMVKCKNCGNDIKLAKS